MYKVFYVYSTPKVKYVFSNPIHSCCHPVQFSLTWLPSCLWIPQVPGLRSLPSPRCQSQVASSWVTPC